MDAEVQFYRTHSDDALHMYGILLEEFIQFILQSLMHKGFLRQLSDEHAGFVNWWLMKRLWSRSCFKLVGGSPLQNILDQLYYKYAEVWEDDL